MSNFKISIGKNTLSILAVVTDAIINFQVEKGQLVQTDKNTNQNEDKKEAQNASLLSRYIRDYFGAIPGTPESRIKKIAAILNTYAHVETFRSLNNNVRRSTDDGTVFTLGQYFYEGTSHPLKRAAREAANKASGKATKTATKAAAKPATKTATKPATKVTTKPAAKPAVAKKPAAKPAPVAKTPAKKVTVKKVKATAPVVEPTAEEIEAEILNSGAPEALVLVEAEELV